MGSRLIIQGEVTCRKSFADVVYISRLAILSGNRYFEIHSFELRHFKWKNQPFTNCVSKVVFLRQSLRSSGEAALVNFRLHFVASQNLASDMVEEHRETEHCL